MKNSYGVLFLLSVVFCLSAFSEEKKDLLSFDHLVKVSENLLIQTEPGQRIQTSDLCSELYDKLIKTEEEIKAKLDRKEDATQEISAALGFIGPCLTASKISFKIDQGKIVILPIENGSFLNNFAFFAQTLDSRCAMNTAKCVKLIYDPADDMMLAGASGSFDISCSSITLSAWGVMALDQYDRTLVHEAMHAKEPGMRGLFSGYLRGNPGHLFDLSKKYIESEYDNMSGSQEAGGYISGYTLDEISAFSTGLVLDIGQLKGLYKHSVLLEKDFSRNIVEFRAHLNGLRNMIHHTTEKLQEILGNKNSFEVSFDVVDFLDSGSGCAENEHLLHISVENKVLRFGMPLSCYSIQNLEKVDEELKKSPEKLKMAYEDFHKQLRSMLEGLKDISAELDLVIAQAKWFQVDPKKDLAAVDKVFESTRLFYEKVGRYKNLK